MPRSGRFPSLAPVLALALALALAGCTAQGGEDPWAYTRKPLYAGGFDLAKVAAAGGNDAQEFRVTDGSIGAIRMLVWVNGTAGDAPTITVSGPSGKTLLTTSETTERSAPLELGAWKVQVQSPAGAEGRVHVLVVRG